MNSSLKIVKKILLFREKLEDQQKYNREKSLKNFLSFRMKFKVKWKYNKRVNTKIAQISNMFLLR